MCIVETGTARTALAKKDEYRVLSQTIESLLSAKIVTIELKERIVCQ
jgi:hypothetical protein